MLVGLAEEVAVGVAEADAVGLGVREGITTAVGIGVGVAIKSLAVYLPLSQTKYPASKTTIKIMTTIVTFLLN